MGGGKNIPRRLYKYRAFSNLTLQMLVADNMFFADPSTFNDPLDTKPTLEADLSALKLEKILNRLVRERISGEMNAAAKKLKYQGSKTIEHINRHSRRRAEALIAQIKYNATDPDYQAGDPLQYLLGRYVEEELLRRFNAGVVSLAERSTCPLMWSHYGDQHRGICIGYSVPERSGTDVYRVKYGGSRLVKASTVAAMLQGSDVARDQVNEAVLLRKAAGWRYEREWRLIGPRGLHNSPLELEEVIFGMRCEDAVKFAVIKALEGRDRRPKFFEVRDEPGRFTLRRFSIQLDDELLIAFPRRSLTQFELFKPMHRSD